MQLISACRLYAALTLACAILSCGCSYFDAVKSKDTEWEDYSLLNEDDAQADSSFEKAASRDGTHTALAAHENDIDFDAESLTLQESIRIALHNSTFFRDKDQFRSRGNSILNQPLQTPSTFDLLIQQSGDDSVKSALSAYSPNLTIGGLYGQNSIVQANTSITSSDVLLNDNASAYARLYKPLQSGGIVSLIQNLNYSASNTSSQLLNPDLAGFVRGELRQPLLAGRGRQFTEIAGPLSYRNRVIGNGISIATIREELPALKQQENVARLSRQTEELFWELWLAERTMQHHQIALDGAKELWDRIKNRSTTGLPGGSVADLAQAEENHYLRLKTLKNSESRYVDAVMQLKRMMGLSSRDKRSMRTAEEPSGDQIELRLCQTPGGNHLQLQNLFLNFQPSRFNALSDRDGQ